MYGWSITAADYPHNLPMFPEDYFDIFNPHDTKTEDPLAVMKMHVARIQALGIAEANPASPRATRSTARKFALWIAHETANVTPAFDIHLDYPDKSIEDK
jgi:hypothetical protein